MRVMKTYMSPHLRSLVTWSTPSCEQRGEDEIADSEPARVIPQNRSRDDPWCVLPPCDLNRIPLSPIQYEGRKTRISTVVTKVCP